ncbi:hypothetical protein ACODM8_02270 [Vibrio ostreicida]|uniref:Uncharacterized protein n=1 Tax=Vibrio ostreicida TaxID=526588 RepID=A0ABT8BW04_9VIBR|nr:hypothetical protein [Vibrio ostreicida]MDN3610581.1 hypothetical protein [Vibrio ostreicida]NPD07420.1 hypothetical protein [Vibrio ostreicida]
MKQLRFRLCEASDGRIYALLSDQPDTEELFDSGYKVAYKYRDNDTGQALLARWRSSYTVISKAFEQIPTHGELPEEVQQAFDAMVASLLSGVDVIFCDYNLSIEADLPIGNGMMDNYRSTDCVLFSCQELIGHDPMTQPYMVSYAVPRYPDTANVGCQHRIYSKTDSFAFAQAINAIVNQRERDALNGGHIRTETDSYINQPTVSQAMAEQEVNRFVEALVPSSRRVAALNAPVN